MDELMEILEELRPDVEFEKEKALIDDHILDSFGVITLVSELEDAFDITIGAKEMVPANFNSVEALFAMVQRLQEN